MNGESSRLTGVRQDVEFGETKPHFG